MEIDILGVKSFICAEKCEFSDEEHWHSVCHTHNAPPDDVSDKSIPNLLLKALGKHVGEISIYSLIPGSLNALGWSKVV